jgi:uncharacterized membrane protein YgcG
VEHLREIEGLAMYVTAEKEFLARINAPEDTAERYERILPYAIALGAGDAWNTRFETILPANYKPSWSSVLAAETLSYLLLGNKRTYQELRYVSSPFKSVARAGFTVGALVLGGSGTSGGSSGGGSGGGGGKGW